MLTEGVETPNAPMLSVADIARRDGVSKPTVSNAVSRLVEKHGLQVVRDSQGRVAGVNIAQYDELRGQTRDPSKDQRKAAALQPPDADRKSYDEAIRLKTLYDAERSRIRLEAEKGDLVPVEQMQAAADALIDIVIRAFDDLPVAADDIAAAVARDGAMGARRELKALATRCRAEIARALRAVSTPPPAETDAEQMSA